MEWRVLGSVVKRKRGAAPLAILLCVVPVLYSSEITLSTFVSPVLDRQVYVPSVGTYRVPAHGAGMSYMPSDAEACQATAALNLRWTHGWQRDPVVCLGVEAVPQISRLWQIGMPLGGNSNYLLFLNEAEDPGQSDVPDPGDAGEALPVALDAYPTTKIVLTSASEDYLDKMLDAAGDVDRSRLVANGHCYAWGRLATALVHCKAHADRLRAWAIDNRITETWITEFGYDPTWEGIDATEAFMLEMVDYYRATGITRWAWFQVNSTAGRWTTGELGLWVDGELTQLGEAYKTQ